MPVSGLVPIESHPGPSARRMPREHVLRVARWWLGADAEQEAATMSNMEGFTHRSQPGRGQEG